MPDLDAAAPPTPVNFRVVALIVASAMFMEQLDATILATALPTMARDFGVTAPGMNVALTSYLLSLAIFIPASGTVADRFGARNVFCAAILIFTGGSLLCARAPTLPLFVAARVAQGIGGAMMMPVGRLVLLRSVERRTMMQAMSWLLTPAMVGPILGPPMGGFIVTYLDWRWIFYVNLPIGLAGAALVGRFIPNTRGDERRSFDVLGTVLSGVALGCLFLGFELTGHPGQGWPALATLGVGATTGWAYLRHARRVPDPILDPALMRIPTFRLSVVAGSLTRMTQGAHPFLLPLMLQIGFGMTAARSGEIVIATAVGSMLMKGFATRILRRWGFRDSLIVNGIVASAGYALCAAFRPDWPGWAMFAILVACGFFMSYQFTAYNTVAFDQVPPERMSSATSFYATFQQLMLSVGVCVAALALQGSMLLRDHVRPLSGDFSAAFLIVTAISLLATMWNRRFAPDAGAVISGHVPQRRAAAALGEVYDRTKSA